MDLASETSGEERTCPQHCMVFSVSSLQALQGWEVLWRVQGLGDGQKQAPQSPGISEFLTPMSEFLQALAAVLYGIVFRTARRKQPEYVFMEIN